MFEGNQYSSKGCAEGNHKRCEDKEFCECDCHYINSIDDIPVFLPHETDKLTRAFECFKAIRNQIVSE